MQNQNILSAASEMKNVDGMTEPSHYVFIVYLSFK